MNLFDEHFTAFLEKAQNPFGMINDSLMVGRLGTLAEEMGRFSSTHQEAFNQAQEAIHDIRLRYEALEQPDDAGFVREACAYLQDTLGIDRGSAINTVRLLTMYDIMADWSQNIALEYFAPEFQRDFQHLRHLNELRGACGVMIHELGGVSEEQTVQILGAYEEEIHRKTVEIMHEMGLPAILHKRISRGVSAALPKPVVQQAVLETNEVNSASVEDWVTQIHAHLSTHPELGDDIYKQRLNDRVIKGRWDNAAFQSLRTLCRSAKPLYPLSYMALPDAFPNHYMGRIDLIERATDRFIVMRKTLVHYMVLDADAVASGASASRFKIHRDMGTAEEQLVEFLMATGAMGKEVAKGHITSFKQSVKQLIAGEKAVDQSVTV